MKKSKEVDISKKLKTIRKMHGYTQESLAEAIECSTRYIGDIEQNRSKPSYEILVRFCNLFHIGMDDIFSNYLDIKERKDINVALFAFNDLSPNAQDAVLHMIEYFNKKAKEK